LYSQHQPEFCDTSAMRSLRAPTLPTRFWEVLFSRSLLALVVLLNLWPVSLSAQEEPANPVPYTLHVYTNLLQVPTLVLTQRQTADRPIPIERFNISLDSGHPFHPTAMHLEGDDPITLAVLLDAGDNQDKLLKTFSHDFAALAPKYLHPADLVSIFAVDCALVRTLDRIPADASTIRAGITAALEDPALHTGGQEPICNHTIRLRDAIVQIVNSMGDAPGRRVLLAVTDGHDGHSTVNWSATQDYASIHGVAAFGMRDVVRFLGNPNSAGIGTAYVSTPTPKFSSVPLSSDLDLFRTFCEFNGGMVYETSAVNLENQLQIFVAMLRGRYIVEFPRPDQAKPGFHSIRVTVSKTKDFVVASGVTYPTDDPDSSDDPDSLAITDPLPAKKSPATFGKRRPLPPPQ
jgi:hypothetical protein